VLNENKRVNCVKVWVAILLVLSVGAVTSVSAVDESTKQLGQSMDLIGDGKDKWLSPGWSRWEFRGGKLIGKKITFPIFRLASAIIEIRRLDIKSD